VSAEELLLAGLSVRAGPPPAAAADWLVQTIAERLDLPPPGVVLDLGAALFGGRAALAVEDDALASAIRRYEDAFLGRIQADPRVVAAGDAAARFGAAEKARAVAVLTSLALAKVGFERGFEIDPGTVRRAFERRGPAVRGNAELRARLAESYLALARGARLTRELVTDGDRFVLEHLDVLGDLGQRLAIADVLAVADAIAPRLPRTRRRRTSGHVAASTLDESTYPAGGFASVSTSGSLENVVTSELVYMDPAAKGVDLFDMRYAEGELLYYTRDEAVLVRRRRHVVIVLGPALARARVKDAGVGWQRIVLALGLVVACTRRFVEALGHEALRIDLVVTTDALCSERALLALILRDFVARGIVTVAAEAPVVDMRRALVDVVRVGGAFDGGARVHDADLGATDLDGWTTRASALLEALV